ncbi:hypothetical protein FC52_GL001608 [Lactobacillus pasteurii DSM 23907 = CRBIP 24.76]|nr:hypothetical protein FC52_GL001608 [Lactobacillus pasteurii DSM 23907 = CRBIP 24.76]
MEDHAPSFTLKRSRVIAYNSNWYNRAERPFTKAHEIGHAISSIVTVLYGGSSYSEEAIADMVATQLLYGLSKMVLVGQIKYLKMVRFMMIIGSNTCKKTLPQCAML